MKSLLRTALVLGVAALFLKGCIFSPDKDDPITGGGEFKEPTSPENVVSNLAESYRRKDIDQYIKLLAPEFIFKFQPVDAQAIETDFWTRDQDSTGTDGLFRTPLVSEIRITLTHGPADTARELDLPDGTMKIRINPTFLEVDQVDGITWQVDGDIQDMFFRTGDPAAGQDSTHWFLIEWRDIPDPAGAPGALGPLTDGSRAAVHQTSWGMLRRRVAP
jgi:hypothetical protein